MSSHSCKATVLFTRPLGAVHAFVAGMDSELWNLPHWKLRFDSISDTPPKDLCLVHPSQMEIMQAQCPSSTTLAADVKFY